MAEHDDYNDQLIAYSVDALDPSEARELETHLRSCAHCQSELEAWRETSSRLAFAVDQNQPGAGLRERILHEVRADKREQQPKTVPQGLSSPKSTPAFFPPPQTLPWWRTSSGIMAIAAGLVLATALASFLISQRRERALKSQIALLSQRLDEERNDLARVKDENELLANPDARALVLLGTGVAPTARAKIIFDNKTGRAMLVAYNLPSAPPGKAYQLWFIANGQPLPGRTFTSDSQGRAVLHDQIPEAGRSASVFAVTLEPESGMPSPTGAKYLLGALT